MRPMCSVARSPMFCHVFPASSDLEIPSPHEELCRLFGSPVPTHTTAGSDGAIAISPIVDTPSLSNTGSHVVPLFVVFHTPPDAVPTYTIFGLLSTTPKSSIRPPITAGPISRNSRFFSLSVGFACPAVSTGATIVSPTQSVAAARIILNADELRFISSSPSVQGRASYLLNASARINCFRNGKPTRAQTDAPHSFRVSLRSFAAPGPCSYRLTRCLYPLGYTSPQPHARLSHCFHRSNAPRERSLSCPDSVRA